MINLILQLCCRLSTINSDPIPQKPYNKLFIDQACSVKMAGYWPRSFFASLWTSTPSRSLGQYPAILTEQAWSITHIFRPNLSDFYTLYQEKNCLKATPFTAELIYGITSPPPPPTPSPELKNKP